MGSARLGSMSAGDETAFEKSALGKERMRTKILVATTNSGKIAELRQMLAMESQLVSLDEVGPFPDDAAGHCHKDRRC